jgi:hypothetical protein
MSGRRRQGGVVTAVYTGEPLLVTVGRACGLHGVYRPDADRRADDVARPVVGAVLVGTPVPVVAAGPDAVERVRAAAAHPRVTGEVRVLVARLTATAGRVSCRVDGLGAARRSGEDAVHEALDAAAVSLEVFARLSADCADRPVPVPAGGPHLPVWGSTRTVREELVDQLGVLDRWLGDVAAAVDAADVAALAGHGRAVSARFGGEYTPVPDPRPDTGPVRTAVRLTGVVWSELAGVAFIVIAFVVIAFALVVWGAR